MVENQEPSKPQKGAWANMNTETAERFPKIEFEVNIAKTVVFLTNEPREMQSKTDDSVYYLFDVEENAEHKVIMTSAWTLLKALKSLEPLTGKKLEIVKKLVKGKQGFEVKEIK